MRRSLVILASLLLLLGFTFSQTRNVYEVYAIEYAKGSSRVAVSDVAIGAKSKDSVTFSFFVWYLKGDNGKRILVDVGFLEDTTKAVKSFSYYQRPDLALQRINVNADDVTDVIITHPHSDHIDGLDLFTKATVWMQKNDFAYFVGDAWQKGASHMGLDKQDVPKIIQANLDGRLQLVNGDSIEIIPGIRVFIGSKHTYESQHLLVNTRTDKVLLASDDSWFYYNLDHLLSVPLTFDPQAYVAQLRRMKTLVADTQLIIPGHDALVLTRFTQVAPGVVRIR
jgi:glyoxylase-like metal-dependent hydrolase (beta-lactamase superfamily II)